MDSSLLFWMILSIEENRPLNYQSLTDVNEDFSSIRARFAAIDSRCLSKSFRFGKSSIDWIDGGDRIVDEQYGIISISNGQFTGWSSLDTDSNSPWMFFVTCQRFK